MATDKAPTDREPARALVLIVEDNERNRRLTRDVLRAGGFDTIEAPDAASALDMARQVHPDVVLLDIRLPDRPGDEVFLCLRQEADTARTPVIAHTAYAMEEDRTRLLRMGFDGYLSKPIDVRTFAAEIRSICSGTRPH